MVVFKYNIAGSFPDFTDNTLIGGKKMSTKNNHFSKKYLVMGMLALCVLGFSVIATMVATNNINSFDERVFQLVQSSKSHFTKEFVKFIGSISAPGTDLVLAFLILAFGITIILYQRLQNYKERIIDFIMLTSVNVAAYVSNPLLKQLFKRQRPGIILLVKSEKYAFPSNHAMMAFALYITLAYVLCQYIHSRVLKTFILISSIIMTLVIGLCRVYLNKHFASDVFAGYFGGGIFLTLGILAAMKIKKIISSTI